MKKLNEIILRMNFYLIIWDDIEAITSHKAWNFVDRQASFYAAGYITLVLTHPDVYVSVVWELRGWAKKRFRNSDRLESE
jgi:hypothetical protein